MNFKRDVSAEQHERHRRILAAVLKLEGNRTCADCRTRNPTWASVNLGVFVCLTCSGIHRSLGVHISQVRSCNLDTWLPKQVEFVRAMGNDKANAYWEAQLPDHFKRPPGGQPNAELAAFIRAKYVDKRYAANDAPPPDINNYVGHPYVEDAAAPPAPAVPEPAAEVQQRTPTPPAAPRSSPAPAAQADLLFLQAPPGPNSRTASPAQAAVAAPGTPGVADPFDLLVGSASSSPAPAPPAAAAAAATAAQTLSLLDHDDWTDFASAPACTTAASVTSSASAADPFAASVSSFSSTAAPAVQQQPAATDPFTLPNSSSSSSPAPAASTVQQPAAASAAAAAADPFASLAGHDLISNIQSMSVSSTNAPALGSAPTAGSSAGSFSAQQQQQQPVQLQHSRSNSGSTGASRKTAEDILKLFDAPQPMLGVATAPRDPYAFMPLQQQQQQGVGSPVGNGVIGAGGMQQQQQQQGMGLLGAAFTHHPGSAMAPVAAAAGGLGPQMNGGSSSPLGRLI